MGVVTCGCGMGCGYMWVWHEGVGMDPDEAHMFIHSGA